MAHRLPTPGSDDGTWGNILNDFLAQEHNSDGSQKTLPISKGGTGATDAATAKANLGAVDSGDSRLSDQRTPLDGSVTPAKLTRAFDRQVFTSSGTWTKPDNVRLVRVIAIGGGGGGGSGGRQASGVLTVAGAPGVPGLTTIAEFYANDLPNSVSITIGTGGTGAAGITTDGTQGGGTNAQGGADTLFGSILRAKGGWQAQANGVAGFNRQQDLALIVGGGGNVAGTAGNSLTLPPSSLWVAMPGAPGGGLTAANTASNGAAGATNQAIVLSGSPVAGTTGTPNASFSGTPSTLADVLYAGLPSYGGAGGASQTAAAGGNGFHGVGYGSSGGGGGASRNGFTSGAGGDGSPGVMIITCWG